MTNEEAIKGLKKLRSFHNGSYGEHIDMAIKALEQQPCEDKGEISDGYHTFNQLYHQRAILFATIVNQNKDKAWKSFKHSDGHYCFDEGGEMFIVGIDTPKGSYTYHYHKKYWDYFNCKELECGKVWDGHTEEDVTRLLSLEPQPCEDCISRQKALDCFEQTNTRQGAKYAIETLPFVTPQRPKGKWKRIAGFKDCNYNKCSVCGVYQLFYYGKPSTNYCPNCGAEMSGGEEGETDN